MRGGPSGGIHFKKTDPSHAAPAVDPLCQDPLCLAKADHRARDPLTPKSAKRSLEGGTESESNPLCSQGGGPAGLQRGGLCHRGLTLLLHRAHREQPCE